ncbi:MAG: permease [Spirochaetaceae bacterium]|nr:permease [Spirochaetaceae bacterium]
MSTHPVAAVRRSLRGWFLFAVGVGAVVLGAALAGRALRTPTAEQAFDPVTWSDRVQAFTTIFLGIFIEAVPFVAIGALLSGVIEMTVSTRTLARFVPRRAGAGVLAGAALGMVFPVCECGVVLVVRRLLSKGLPPPVAIAFLLGAPVLNPVVIASTATAFGFGWMLIGRLALTLVVATAVAAAFRRARPADILLAADRVEGEARTAGSGHAHHHEHDAHHHEHEHAPGDRPAHERRRSVGSFARDALLHGSADLFDMGRYLVIGCGLAALLQTLMPQSVLMDIGRGGPASVATMLGLGYLLSVCSSVDAFLALAFTNTFAPAAILAFLVFGPMVDVKSTLLFLSVFRTRAVVYLVVLPLVLTFATALIVHNLVPWA